MRDHATGNIESIARRREQLETLGLLALSGAAMFIMGALAVIAVSAW